MNFAMLSRMRGRQLHLHPVAERWTDAGQRLEDLDDPWQLESVEGRPKRVRLVNLATGHCVNLYADGIKEYREPHYLILRCRVILKGNSLTIQPLVEGPNRTLPISAYQAKQGALVSEIHTPTTPEVCQGCTAAVVFRPLVHLRLLGQDNPQKRTEQFCPVCARKRGCVPQLPAGMTADVMFAEQNPTLAYHIKRLAKAFLLPALSGDALLHAGGVSHVGAAVSARSIALLVSLRSGRLIEIPIPIHELDPSAAQSDLSLLDELRRRVLSTVRDERA